jgi:hypothetical protein
MSYTTPPPSGYAVPAQPQPSAPGTVRISSLLLWLLGLISLISGALAVYQGTLLTKDKVLPILEDAGMNSTEADAAASVFGLVFYGTGFISILFAVLFFVLALFVGRGKQWARITTWVVGGLNLCCGLAGLGLGGSSFASGMGGGTDTSIDSDRVNQGIADLVPSWLESVSLVLSIVSLIALIVVIILLALPPSHPYFRKAEPVWTPPPSYPSV